MFFQISIIFNIVQPDKYKYNLSNGYGQEMSSCKTDSIKG